jgi:hypothetical protein
LSRNDNGFPSFREDLFDGPYDCGDLLGPRIFIGVAQTGEPPDLSELKTAVRADLALFDYFGGDMFCDTNTQTAHF